jgi:hypothetical protein
MNRLFIIVVNLLLITICLQAQDIILKRDNTIIKANVLSVKPDIVTYKKFDNPNGPTYELKKQEITKIVYKNDTEDVFSLDQKKDSTFEKGSSVETTKGAKNSDSLKAGDLNYEVLTDTRPECEKNSYGMIQIRNVSQYQYDFYIDNVFIKRLEPKSVSGKISIPEGNNRCLTVSQVSGYLISPTVKTSYFNVVRCSDYTWQIPH